MWLRRWVGGLGELGVRSELRCCCGDGRGSGVLLVGWGILSNTWVMMDGGWVGKLLSCEVY